MTDAHIIELVGGPKDGQIAAIIKGYEWIDFPKLTTIDLSEECTMELPAHAFGAVRYRRTDRVGANGHLIYEHDGV